MKINRKRKRAIEKARIEMERYDDWKEYVQAVGGVLIKGKGGKYRGVIRGD